MTEKRTPGIPEEPCKRVAPAKASSEARLEALQNIFLSPPKFVVGTTASEQAYQLMVGTKGGLSAFWEDAIRNFNRDLETLVRAAAAFSKQSGKLGGISTASVAPTDGFPRISSTVSWHLKRRSGESSA